MAEHVSDPNDLAAEVTWHIHEPPRNGAYVRVTMRNRHTNEFLSKTHQEEPCWWDRPIVLAAERKALRSTSRVACGLLPEGT